MSAAPVASSTIQWLHELEFLLCYSNTEFIYVHAFEMSFQLCCFLSGSVWASLFALSHAYALHSLPLAYLEALMSVCQWSLLASLLTRLLNLLLFPHFDGSHLSPAVLVSQRGSSGHRSQSLDYDTICKARSWCAVYSNFCTVFSLWTEGLGPSSPGPHALTSHPQSPVITLSRSLCQHHWCPCGWTAKGLQGPKEPQKPLHSITYLGPRIAAKLPTEQFWCLICGRVTHLPFLHPDL